jgi:hypothetical protein
MLRDVCARATQKGEHFVLITILSSITLQREYRNIHPEWQDPFTFHTLRSTETTQGQTEQISSALKLVDIAGLNLLWAETRMPKVSG